MRRGEPANDLRVLAATSPEGLRAITNNGKVSRRYKAEVVTDAAAALHKAGRLKAQDFRDNQEAAEAPYLSVKGCGPVRWAYIGMLSEADGIKTDIWLKRFVPDRIANASQEQVTPELTAVPEQMNIEAGRLDHAMWAYRRSAKAPHESQQRPKRRRSRCVSSPRVDHVTGLRRAAGKRRRPNHVVVRARGITSKPAASFRATGWATCPNRGWRPSSVTSSRTPGSVLAVLVAAPLDPGQ